ncbi:ferric reductase-like transmembrane domain-containing protein [Rhodococcus sp. 1168]|uniref:ferric reductase-like transmembrane domain-containing protein n=1 Tax=Rhodococcus sp. 1168 TaxID=2018041 RepID=UPI000A0DB650|nr:ferric reductase-like transmembrane domain-containing protein [Rhodococcus sp. 1168]ORI13501.1 iron reductase [Rhodococcus sp. 1168]
MDQAFWAFGRGAGVAALVILTLAVASGIVTRSGRPLLSLTRFGVAELHKSTSLLGSLLIMLHLTSLFFDPYAQLDITDSLVPFLGRYRPFWLGLGTLAVDLVILIMITVMLRHRLAHRLFRVVHWSSYALWPIAFAHALGNGTDVGHTWFLVIAALCAALVAATVAFRLRHDFLELHHTRAGAQR